MCQLQNPPSIRKFLEGRRKKGKGVYPKAKKTFSGQNCYASLANNYEESISALKGVRWLGKKASGSRFLPFISRRVKAHLVGFLEEGLSLGKTYLNLSVCVINLMSHLAGRRRLYKSAICILLYIHYHHLEPLLQDLKAYFAYNHHANSVGGFLRSSSYRNGDQPSVCYQLMMRWLIEERFENEENVREGAKLQSTWECQYRLP